MYLVHAWSYAFLDIVDALEVALAARMRVSADWDGYATGSGEAACIAALDRTADAEAELHAMLAMQCPPLFEPHHPARLSRLRYLRALDTIMLSGEGEQQCRLETLAVLLAECKRLLQAAGHKQAGNTSRQAGKALAQRLLEACRRQLGEAHEYTATAAMAVAETMMMEERFAEAEPLLRAACCGVDSGGCGWAGRGASDTGCVSRMGQLEEADALYRQVLPHCRALYGDTHEATSGVLNCLRLSGLHRRNAAAAQAGAAAQAAAQAHPTPGRRHAK